MEVLWPLVGSLYSDSLFRHQVSVRAADTPNLTPPISALPPVTIKEPFFALAPVALAGQSSNLLRTYGRGEAYRARGHGHPSDLEAARGGYAENITYRGFSERICIATITAKPVQGYGSTCNACCAHGSSGCVRVPCCSSTICKACLRYLRGRAWSARSSSLSS